MWKAIINKFLLGFWKLFSPPHTPSSLLLTIKREASSPEPSKHLCSPIFSTSKTFSCIPWDKVKTDEQNRKILNKWINPSTILDLFLKFTLLHPHWTIYYLPCGTFSLLDTSLCTFLFLCLKCPLILLPSQKHTNISWPSDSAQVSLPMQCFPYLPC